MVEPGLLHKIIACPLSGFSRQCSEEQRDALELAQGETGCSLLPLVFIELVIPCLQGWFDHVDHIKMCVCAQIHIYLHLLGLYVYFILK